MAKQGVVRIHNKNYKTVALRVSEFRADYPIASGWAVITEIIALDEECAVVKASIINPDGVVVATGHGEEFRKASNINKTSALENGETSAVGRALAAAGLGGEEYASADEVTNAIKTQETMEKNPETAPKKADKKETPLPDLPSEDIPDDIMEVVIENCKIASKIHGREEYNTWHRRTLANFFNGATALTDLEPEQLVEFADYQKVKLGTKEK